MRKKTWDNVGWHATPEKFSAEFRAIITPFVRKKFNQRRKVVILDLFAGDGRLGKEAESILHQKNTYTTYVEVVKNRAKKIKGSPSKYAVIVQNAFSWEPNKKFDLIVSNPPYQLLTGNDSEKYGFSWDYAREHARNLYAMGIVKCLELCEANGMVAVIAPFSWLRGQQSEKFRTKIESYCSYVFIKANNNRGIFEDVHQDVGIQIFFRRNLGHSEATKWLFSYNGSKKYVPITVHNSNKFKKISNLKIRVGPIVWNRSKKHLASTKNNKTIPLVYGGNISHDGTLNLESERYSKKQYIRMSGVQKTDLYHSPLLLIRRIMRGRPGKWEIDSCLLTKKIFCTVENHVIVIQLPTISTDKAKKFHKQLISKLTKYYYLSGSPNISTRVVQEIAGKIY